MNRYHAVFAAAAGQVVDGLLDGLGHGTHRDDDVLGLLVTVIGERTIFAAGELADLAHVAGNDVRNGIIELVAGLDTLEIDVAILGGTAGDRSVRIQGAGTEILQGLGADHSLEGLLVEGLDFLDFVRGAETVEEMQERNRRLNGGQVCDGGHVLSLLDGAGSQQGETGLAAGHHILVITEDGQGVRCQGTGRYMENGREHFTGNLIHVRNHQQETLRCGISGGEHAGLERSVDRSRGTGLALHLSHFDEFSPKVLFPMGGPLVDVLGHRGRGRDWIDGSVLAEKISDVCNRSVAITGDEFFFFCHIAVLLYCFY